MARKSRFDLSELMAKIETMKQQGKSNRYIGKEIGISEGYIRKLMRTNDLNKVRTNEPDKTLTNKPESKTNQEQVKKVGQPESKNNEQNTNKTESAEREKRKQQAIINMYNKGKTEQEMSDHWSLSIDYIHMVILKYQLNQIKE